MNRQRRICHRFLLREMARKDSPRNVEERTIALRWLKLLETNPEQTVEIKSPAEIMKKSDPASPCPITRSFSILGIKGAKIILEVNITKKMEARKSKGIT